MGGICRCPAGLWMSFRSMIPKGPGRGRRGPMHLSVREGRIELDKGLWGGFYLHTNAAGGWDCPAKPFFLSAASRASSEAGERYGSLG
eukprot:1366423-Amorphochlora_amoeboformis.AAC.1